MTGAQAEGALEDAQFPVDCGGLCLFLLATGFIAPNISGAEIRSSRFPQPWAQMQFEARKNIVDAALTVFSVISYNKIKQLIERCAFNGNATKGAGCDLSEPLSQESLAVLRTHRTGGLVYWLAFRIVLDPPDFVSLINGSGFGFPSHESKI